MMNLPVKIVAFLSIAFVAGIVIVGNKQKSKFAGPRRRLGLKDHESKQDTRNVNASSMYDYATMQYMASPCRPELDGFFGSTSGTPIEIQYGFEMETANHDKVDNVLEAIQERLMDLILAAAFPNLCGYSDSRRELAQVQSSYLAVEAKKANIMTGLKFGMGLKTRAGTCSPKSDPKNLCGIYMNSLSIYGRRLDGVGDTMLQHIRESLNAEEGRLAHVGLVRLNVAEYLTKQVGDYDSALASMGVGGLPLIVKAAIIVAVLAITAGLMTIILYILLDRQNKKEHQSYINNKGNKGTRSTNSSKNESKHAHRDGTAVVMEGGRPVVIEFDHNEKRGGNQSICERSSLSRSAAVQTNGDAFLSRSLESGKSVQSDEDSVPKVGVHCQETETLDSFVTISQVSLPSSQHPNDQDYPGEYA